MRKHPGETFYLVPTILLTHITLNTLDQAHKGLLFVLPPIESIATCYLHTTTFISLQTTTIAALHLDRVICTVRVLQLHPMASFREM